MPRKPRINVAVTKEQHALLLELAELQGGSAAGYLRQQLDASTPLLRVAVPMLRRAAQEIELTKKEAARLLSEAFKTLDELEVLDQIDLFDRKPGEGGGDERNVASGASEAERSRSPQSFPGDSSDA